MGAINAGNKAPVRSAKAYVTRAKVEAAPNPPPPREKTPEEIADEAGLAVGSRYRNALISHLRTNLRYLRGSIDTTTGLPWTKELIVEYFVINENPASPQALAIKAKRKAALEEKKKNFKPTDAETFAFMKQYCALRTKVASDAEAMYDQSLCTCCGAMEANYPGTGNYPRLRWQVLPSDTTPTGIHGTESLRIKDAETGKDLYLSWNNK